MWHHDDLLRGWERVSVSERFSAAISKVKGLRSLVHPSIRARRSHRFYSCCLFQETEYKEGSNPVCETIGYYEQCHDVMTQDCRDVPQEECQEVLERQCQWWTGRGATRCLARSVKMSAPSGVRPSLWRSVMPWPGRSAGPWPGSSVSRCGERSDARFLTRYASRHSVPCQLTTGN